MTLVTGAGLTARRCPVCGAPGASCGGPTSHVGVLVTVSSGGGAMPDLARYVDEKGNIFSMTKADAEKLGYKPYVAPPKSGEAPAEKAVRQPPADKSR